MGTNITNKKAELTGDSITSILFWIIVLALAIGSVVFLIRFFVSN
jgi:hypothetical protein